MSFFERYILKHPPRTASLLLGSVLLFPLSLLGANLEAAQSPRSEHFEAIDKPRDFLSHKFIGFVSDIDRFFGDDRNYEESNQSVVQLDLTRATGYGGDAKTILTGRAKVRLPSTEKRFHLLLESNPDKNISGEPTQLHSTPIQEISAPESYAAALRIEQKQAEEKPWHTSADAGIKFQGINTKPFARARGSYSIPLADWRLKAVETVFWFNSIGVGESTQLDIERFLSEPLLFRASSNVTWLHDKQNFDLRQDFSLYHTLNSRTALLYQASAIGVSNPHRQVNDYVILMVYRYRLHRDWIFFELSPQVHFPREKNYQSSTALLMRLEMLFDGS